MDTKAKRIHKTLAITTFNKELYSAYAHRFVETFPHRDLDLKIYSEDTAFEFKTTFLHLPKEFVERNSHRTIRSYKNDAVRFCYKPYAIAQCLGDWAYKYTRLLWIDADTRFHKRITEDWIDEHLYKESALMTYMGRPNYYSETGLLLFNLEHPECHNYINTVRNYYDTDNIYLLPEQHDSYVWDYVRKHYETKHNTEFHNVGVAHKVKGGHIQAHLYGEWFDHMKGKRKQQGYSQELKR